MESASRLMKHLLQEFSHLRWNQPEKAKEWQAEAPQI